MANVRKAPVGDLFHRYVYTMRDLNVGNSEHVVVLHDEERKFFEIAKDANDLNDEKLATEKLKELRRYTEELAEGIKDAYISLFTGKWDELSPETNDTWISLENSIPNGKILQDYTYNGLYLICQSLLFLLRTTRRAMFIYITAGGATERDTKSNVKNSMEAVYKYIRDFLRNIDNNEKEFIQTISQLEETSIELSQLAQANQNALEAYKQKEADYKKKLSNCSKEVETYRNKEEAERLRKEKEVTNAAALEAKRRRAEEQERRAEEARIRAENNAVNNAKREKDFNENLEKISKLSDKFVTMFSRFIAKYNSQNPETLNFNNIHKETLLSQSVECTAEKSNINNVNSVILSTLNEYKKRLDEEEFKEGFEIAQGLLIEKNIIDESSMSESVFVDYIPLLNVLWKLSKIHEQYSNLNNIKRDIKKLAMLYPPSLFYTKLFLLYEDMSGAVRVIVRMRDMYAPKMGGFQKKRKAYESERDKSRKRRRMRYVGGGDGDLSPYYEINLEENTKNVRFENIASISEYYTDTDILSEDKTAYIFGPFHGVHHGGETEEEILSKSLNYEGMKTVLLKGDNIVLYTYGYSGSGKTYTLFGKKGSTESGLVWKILKALEGDGISVQLTVKRKCYGYLTGTKDNFVFNDDLITTKGNLLENTLNIEQKCIVWGEELNKDTQEDLNNEYSFIKKTANNPESSRGFYILKFQLTYENKEIGSLGVVDMAGNEDPFDIATSMCPSLKFEEMHQLVQNPKNITAFDFVFEGLSKQLNLILVPEIMNCLILAYVGTEMKVELQLAYNRKGMIKSTFINEENTPYISSLKQYQNGKTITIQKEEIKNMKARIKRNEEIVPLVILKLANRDNAYAELNIKRDFLEDVFTIVKKEYIASLKNQNEAQQYVDKITSIKSEEEKLRIINDIAEIKKLVISVSKKTKVENAANLSDAEKLKLRLILLVGANISQISIDSSLTIDLPVLSLPITIHDMNVPNVLDRNIGKIIRSLTQVINDFSTTQKYFIALDDLNLETSKMSYNRISQIIREGYYINKANAELMKFFNDKRNFTNHKDGDFEKMNYVYKFNEFGFTQYNKFNWFFTPCTLGKHDGGSGNQDPKTSLFRTQQFKPKTTKSIVSARSAGEIPTIRNNVSLPTNIPKSSPNTSTTSCTSLIGVKGFDTKLVKGIVDLFGKDAKDIMFTCIRNDKDLGKALGAIDTLLLVKELKST